MHVVKIIFLVLILSATGWLLLPGATGVPVWSQPILPPEPASGAIRFPDDHEPPATAAVPVPAAQTGGLKAVAIVGEFGDHTAAYKNEMDDAAAALQSHDVTVLKFYYGDTSFTWADIAAAAQGAHFLLYIGHGVYGGSLPDPDWVGGFYLGPGQFVSPDQIRTDLGGKLASNSIVILSHACFTTGSSGDSSSVEQSKAEQWVKMYAEPFTDIGMQAYFANNYYYSATRTVNLILSQNGHDMEEVFKGGIGYNPANFIDLTYPEPGYDLWLDGTVNNWSLSFVGIPGYVFQAETPSPALGDLPDALSFIYSIPDQRLLSTSYQVTPANVGNDDPFTWNVTTTGTWFAVSPLTGSSPDSFQIAPTTFSTSTVVAYTGALTLTVVSPPGVDGSPHRINLSLRVINSPISDVYLPVIKTGCSVCGSGF
jgi:hypothetical protein